MGSSSAVSPVGERPRRLCQLYRRKSTLFKVIRFFVIFMCVGCFVGLCWEQLSAYFERRMGVSQRVEMVGRRAMTPLLFCPMHPYKVTL